MRSINPTVISGRTSKSSEVLPMKFGENLKLEIYGASHSEKLDVILKNIPSGHIIDREMILEFMARRAPGNDPYSTPRKEKDEPIVTSGIENGMTTGDDIKAYIQNTNRHSSDYSSIRYTPRPGHADYAAYLKYGPDYDPTGGGAFSGRMTAPLCFAGAVCLQLLSELGVSISAKPVMIGGVWDDEVKMKEKILRAKAEGDSVGGIIECTVKNFPVGIGGPMWDGIEGKISSCIFGIPAVKGIEFGKGFESAELNGSENNDAFIYDGEKITTKTNNCGGILGGISNGCDIVFRVAFKPTPSIAKTQKTVDLRTNEPVEISVPGRHDPCVVLRAVPCVEAACAVALYDMLL
ncbi:MAG: chorismate synthase [Clostridia bacterium]|nr:chorismate synthase [Clostridia bacterium]